MTEEEETEDGPYDFEVEGRDHHPLPHRRFRQWIAAMSTRFVELVVFLSISALNCRIVVLCEASPAAGGHRESGDPPRRPRRRRGTRK